MEYRTLEINVISAKDLKKVNLISKTQAYAVVSFSGDQRASQQQRTAVDRSGNGSPTWNFPVKFTVDESAARSNRLSITFRIRCERTLGDKDIGEVHVPISELIGSVEDGKLKFVTYQVRKPSGKPKGELNFSYKWGEKIVGATPPAMEVNKAPMEVNKDQGPVTAYPAQVGSSSAYPPPPTGYAYPSQGGYPSASAAGYGYPPPPQYGAYPQQPPPPGYGYPPPQPGYGYPPVQQPQQPAKKKFGLGLGAGLLGGALGGLLIGDVISDGFGGGGGCGGGGCGGGGCGGG